MAANSNTPPFYPRFDRDLGQRVDAQATSTHHNLRHLFHLTEDAIANNAFEQGAAYLGELIDAARDHFRTAEDIAFQAGLAKHALNPASHGALLDRARILQARCQNKHAGVSVSAIRNELVVLLSDMVEYDIHFANEVELAQAFEGEQEA